MAQRQVINSTIPEFQQPCKKAFEDIVGKGENAGNQHFLLFSKCFLSYERRVSSCDLHVTFNLANTVDSQSGNKTSKLQGGSMTRLIQNQCQWS